MKLRKRTASFVSFSALAGLLFFVTGCARDPDISDEFARIASQEVANMDANASMGITGGLSKSTAAAADTINNDLIIAAC